MVKWPVQASSIYWEHPHFLIFTENSFSSPRPKLALNKNSTMVITREKSWL